jgi:hypothetical protein
MELDAADQLLAKLRAFIADELDEEERKLFAALIAPGVARAYDTTEVAGFDMVDWKPSALPQSLVDALRRGGVRVEGLGL